MTTWVRAGAELGPPDFIGCPAWLWLSTRGPIAGEAPLIFTEEASLPLAVTKEAKVSTLPKELQEDQLGEDELTSPETQ